MTTLLLFTNDYPYARGDVVFVEKEIGDLAARFDEVVVFCHERDTTVGLVEMPANVRLAGNLFEPAPEDSLWTPLRPRMLAMVIRAAGRELVSGRLWGHLYLFLAGARVGITQANRRAVREAIEGSTNTVAYGFWGMGGGLAIAWLRGVDARVVRLHGYDLYEERSESGYLPFRRYLLSRVDRVLAISRHGEQYLARRYGGRSLTAKIRLSRLGVPGPESLERLAVGAERIVVSCSAISDIKRVDLILEALKVLPRLSTDEPVRWVHFGDGPHFDALRAAAAVVPPGLTVELRGQRPNREVAEFYSRERVDVFLNASTTEGVPVSIMEAIAYDIPVVATAVGGTPEIVGSDLGSGELVPADASAHDLAHAVRMVLDAAPDTYAPRRLWGSEYDVRVTGPRAAELVRGLLPR
jgi:colanic acid/amylovoran biosynthesis glycosyltransferase